MSSSDLNSIDPSTSIKMVLLPYRNTQLHKLYLQFPIFISLNFKVRYSIFTILICSLSTHSQTSALVISEQLLIMDRLEQLGGFQLAWFLVERALTDVISDNPIKTECTWFAAAVSKASSKLEERLWLALQESLQVPGLLQRNYFSLRPVLAHSIDLLLARERLISSEGLPDCSRFVHVPTVPLLSLRTLYPQVINRVPVILRHISKFFGILSSSFSWSFSWSFSFIINRWLWWRWRWCT